MLAVLGVPGDFSTIQDAIDHARIGDTVQIAAGLYEESLDLTRMGSAIGSSSGDLRIQGDSPAVVVRASAGAALSNSAPFVGDLRVQLVTFESPVASSSTAGIALDDVSGKFEFRDLIFRNLAGAALHAEHVDGELFVTDSVFEATGGQDRADALHVLDLTGIGVIHANAFHDVTGTAIRVEQTGSLAVLMISGNEITGDASFFQTTGDGIIVSSSGTAQLDLSLDTNQLENLRGRGIDVQVGDQSRLQSRWTKNTLQQIRGDSALTLHVEDSGEAALAVFGNSVLDTFGNGMSVTLEQAAQARAVIRDNLFLGIGDGEAKAGLTIATATESSGSLTALVDNNTIDTIAGNGLQLIADGAASVAVALTDNFFTGTNTTGGTDAVVLQSAAGGTATVQASIRGNRVIDPFGGAYRLSAFGGSLGLAASSQTPGEELAATNQGQPVRVDGTVQLIPVASLDAVMPLLLGDFVWLDKNGNGLADSGEPGQAFVRVHLNGTAAAGGTVARSTLTDAAGKYYFSALLPGDYSLELETRLGFRLTAANQGANDAIDSDFDRTTKTAMVTLAAASEDLTVDAGLEQTWQNPANRFDVNGDGFASPIDALQLINEINDNGTYLLQIPYGASNAPPPYLDVDGDGFIAPIDVLQVINHLNEAVGEGEAASEGRPHMATLVGGHSSEMLPPSAANRTSVGARFAAAPRDHRIEEAVGSLQTIGRFAQRHRGMSLRCEPTTPLDPRIVDWLLTD
jgi:hypothetical protein